MSFPALCSTELLAMFEEQKDRATRVMRMSAAPYPVSKTDRHAWQEHPVKRRESRPAIVTRSTEREPLHMRLQARRNDRWRSAG